MIVKNLLKRVGIFVVVAAVLAGNFAFALPTTVLATGDTVDEIHFSYGENTGEVVFNWRGAETTFYYGLDSSYGNQATAYVSAITPWDTTGPFHEVKITGLADDTDYHYKIGELGLDHTFKTRPTGDFSWVDVGDTVSSHCFSYMPALHQLITDQQPNLVTHGGDISVLDGCGVEAAHSYYTDQEVWSNFAAFQPVWGNHEYAEAKPEAPAGTPRDSLANYKGRSYVTNAQTVPTDTASKLSNPGCGGDQGSTTNTCMGEDWGWFDAGKVRFISYPEPWPGALEDWRVKADTLMQQAQNDENIDFIITYGHRPPYTNSVEGPNLTVRTAVDYLAQKYSPRADNQSGKYILNVGHHAHGLEAYGKVNGLMHVLSAAGGQGFTPTAGTTPPSEFRVRRLGILSGNYNAQNGTLDIKFVCGPEFTYIQDVCEYGSTLWNMSFAKSQAPTEPEEPPTPTLTEWVSNTGIESNLTGWTGKYAASNYVTVARSTEAAHTGSASVKVAGITGANNLASGFNDNPKIVASTTIGTEYTQSVWVKPGHVGQKITLRLREWRPNWAMAGEVSKTLTATSTSWQQISQTYTAKENGNNFAYIVHANAISAGQYFYTDDLSLTTGVAGEPEPEEPPIPPTPTTKQWVSNLGIETDLTGWTGKYGSSPYIDVDRSTEAANTGLGSIKVRALTGASGLSSGFNANPRLVTSATLGKTYTGSIWVKPGHTGQAITLSLIEWSGSTKVNEVKTKITATNTNWQQITVNLPAEQNGTQIAFAVYGGSMNSGHYFYVDDLSLTSPN